MKVKIVLEPTHSKQWPKLKLTVRDNVIFDGFCEPNNGKFFSWKIYLEDSNLQKQNSIVIEHYDKQGSDTVCDNEGNVISDRAIILKSIEFDDMSVPEVLLYNQKFYPDWPDQPEYTRNDLYFGYNGKYIFNFADNSKKMYYNFLLEKEFMANMNNKKLIQLPNGEEIESFEFNGKLVSGSAKQTIDLEDLYKRVMNES